jgi:hypothetical protein
MSINDRSRVAAVVVILTWALTAVTGIADAQSFVPLRIVDIPSVPSDDHAWGANVSNGLTARILWKNERGGRLLLARGAPVGHVLPPPLTSDSLRGGRIHQSQEWEYFISGETLEAEFASPDQIYPVPARWRAGMWLQRPPFSMHGGPSGEVREEPAEFFLYEEEPPPGIGVDPRSREYDAKVIGAVKRYTYPRRIDALHEMRWEPDPQLAGASMKWLADDRDIGFRAKLHLVPAGWKAPDAHESLSYARATRFVMMIEGDIAITTADAAKAPGRRVVLTKANFVQQSPGSRWQWADGTASEQGAVWLEVEYARGTIAADGAGPIEAPIRQKETR